MRVNCKPRHRNSPRIAEKSAPAFLQWLRGRNCAVGPLGCSGRIEAAHVDHAGGKGIATKVRDSAAIPLCACHHHAQHYRGWKTFEFAKNIDAVALAESYWRAWPGRIAWERKLADNG